MVDDRIEGINESDWRKLSWLDAILEGRFLCKPSINGRLDHFEEDETFIPIPDALYFLS